MQIHTKRIYEQAAESDGSRILVDRVWPRGISKQKADIVFWAKDMAPSSALRQWYRHDPDKWSEFRRRYFHELQQNPDALQELRRYLEAGVVTLVYAARETHYNNATALKEFLEQNP